MLRAEDQQRGASALHGAGGPLRVSDPASPHPLSLAFVEAAASVGHAINPDFNGDSQAGVGLYQCTISRGARWSAANAHLDVARGRTNLSVLTGAQATRLKVAGRRCTGVELYWAGGIETVTASREVVVCCRTIDSPRLLMLFGIGDPDELRALGLPVVAALPGVGRNLHDHPTSAVLQAARQPRPPADSSNHAEAGLFMKASSVDDGFDADLQFHFLPCAPVLACNPDGACPRPGDRGERVPPAQPKTAAAALSGGVRCAANRSGLHDLARGSCVADRGAARYKRMRTSSVQFEP